MNSKQAQEWDLVRNLNWPQFDPEQREGHIVRLLADMMVTLDVLPDDVLTEVVQRLLGFLGRKKGLYVRPLYSEDEFEKIVE